MRYVSPIWCLVLALVYAWFATFFARVGEIGGSWVLWALAFIAGASAGWMFADIIKENRR